MLVLHSQKIAAIEVMVDNNQCFFQHLDTSVNTSKVNNYTYMRLYVLVLHT